MKVTPINESMVSIGENVPSEFPYSEPENQGDDLSRSSKKLFNEIKKMQQLQHYVNMISQHQDKEPKESKIKEIIALVVSILTLAAAIIPIVITLNSTTTSSNTGKNVTTSTSTIATTITSSKTSFIASTISIVQTTTMSTTSTTSMSTTSTTTTSMPTTITTTITTITEDFKVMVIGSIYGDLLVEVVDVLNPSKMCNHLQDFPFSGLYGISGGLLQNRPVICGGKVLSVGYNTKCYILNTKEAIFEDAGITYDHNCGFPQSVVLGNKLWFSCKISSKWVYFDQSDNLKITNGSNIPTTYGTSLTSHCVIKLSETMALMTGGLYQGKKTLFVDATQALNLEFDLGPEMIIGRHNHGCGTISINNTTFLVVVGGWSEELGTSLDSTEMLDILDSNAGWIEGPKLPTNCFKGKALSLPNGKELFLGGCDEDVKAFYKLEVHDSAFSWIKMAQMRSQNHHSGEMMWIPDAMTNCMEQGFSRKKLNVTEYQRKGYDNLNVNCGAHFATICEDCPSGKDPSWCHGDCEWNSLQNKCNVRMN